MLLGSPIKTQNLIGLAVSAGATETIVYTYDAKGRLVKVERSGSVNDGVKTDYSHDRADNRQNVKVTGASRFCNPATSATYSSSSTYPSCTGLSGDGAGVRDAVYSGAGSVHGTAAGDTSPWLIMDLGTATAVGSVIVAPISSSFGGWGPTYLNGALLKQSADAVNWTDVTTVSGTADNSKTAISVNATVRYLRLLKNEVWLGVGDFCVANSVQLYDPIVPATYSASSDYGYTGLSGNGSGMRDGTYTGPTSVHGTAASDTTPWIMMDLGSAQTVGFVVVAPISSSFGGWGPTYLNGALLQRSTDAVNWSDVTTVSDSADNTRTVVDVNATARYLRSSKTHAWLAAGDFYAVR